MGVSISRYSDLTDNELLARFCSVDAISPNDPFWNQLLSFNITPPATVDEQLFFDSSIETLLQQFLSTNPETGNLGSLIQVFITRAAELLAAPSTDNAMLAWQTFNALFVIRAVIKYLVEMMPERNLAEHFELMRRFHKGQLQDQIEESQSPPPSPATEVKEVGEIGTDSEIGSENVQIGSETFKVGSENVKVGSENVKVGIELREVKQEVRGSESKLEMLCDALLGLICDVPVTDNTYYLHLECINTILVLMSVYMFASVHGETRPIENSFIYRTLFQGRYAMHAPLLVKTLLQNFYTLRPAPAHMFGCHDDAGSLVINLASGLWNMLTFSAPTQNPSILTQPPPDISDLPDRIRSDHPTSNQSCLLLLALSNRCPGTKDLYRDALLSARDIAETTSTTPSKNGPTTDIQVTPPRIDMAALHKAICATASCEHSTLLLYLMLHSCAPYRRHVLSCNNIDELILPLLQCLYKAPESSSHHIYMALIVLLILTEDDTLIKNVHLIEVKNPTWYTERTLSSISLGGLCILVIIRTVQHNIARVRDKYLHTNCLAALANMSCEFRNLHPYVSQRLVSLFETLSKRRARLALDAPPDQHGLDLIHGDEKAEELWEHVCVLDEVLRMLLEILNSCLSNQLQNNLNLVYALLHKKAVFAHYKTQPRHAPILNNIEMVIGYFSSRLQRVQEGAGGGDLGVGEVLAVIKKGAEQWSNDRLKKFPDLKFRYVEEEKPEEFFTPYVWSVISARGGVYWASECGARALRDLLAC